MDDSTRPSQTRRQDRAQIMRRLAALVCAGALAAPSLPLTAATPAGDLQSPEIVSSIAQDASHEVAIRNVEEGRETISLSARLSTGGNVLAENVAWEIRSIDGELLLKDTQTELNAALAPGSFVIEARYGSVSIREPVTLLKGHALAVNFVLNAGGLRVLPAVKNVSAIDVAPHTLVYALSGPLKGKLITHSDVPGEVMKVPAGQYRVESRYGFGNTMVVADVRVKPGRISAVEIKHNAGLARLSYVGASTADVTWLVSSEGGQEIAKASGLNHAFVLRPGAYVAEASVNGEVLSARFRIGVGEERDILLGN